MVVTMTHVYVCNKPVHPAHGTYNNNNKKKSMIVSYIQDIIRNWNQVYKEEFCIPPEIENVQITLVLGQSKSGSGYCKEVMCREA